MTDDRVAALEHRLERIENERAIERLIASYGPLVDAGDAEGTAALWAPDGGYHVEDWRMHNREEVAEMVRSDAHQGLIGRGCAHFLGPAVVTVDGSSAVAVCESLLVTRSAENYRVARAGANYFRLARNDGRWQIVNRWTRMLDGRAEARALLGDGVMGRAR